MNTVQDVINIARSQVGTQETPPGSNRVKYWDQIGRSDAQGESWCACFVTWCMIQAKVPFPSIDTPHGYVYCPDAVTFGRAHGELVNSPQAGDIVLFDWNHDAISDHTGIVTGVSGQSFTTIEGNSGTPGSVRANSWANHEFVVAFFRPPYGSNAPTGPTPIAIKLSDANIVSALAWLARRRSMLGKSPTGGFAVARPDGAVDNFGNSRFYGSMAGRPMNAPVVAMAYTKSGNGYWLIGEDGGIFNFGDAPLLGPAFHYYKDWNIGLGTQSPIVGICADDNGGYTIMTDNPNDTQARPYDITADGRYKN